MTTDILAEEWRSIPGLEGRYEVSDMGRVRSVDRMVMVHWASGPRPRLHRGKLIASVVTRYERTNLRVDGTQRCFLVHRLVAAAFIGPCPTGHVVCHNNGDALDNRAANLRYDTPEGNVRDTLKHGTHPWARRTHCIHGHEWTDANVRIDKTNGARRCRTCERERAMRRRRELERTDDRTKAGA